MFNLVKIGSKSHKIGLWLLVHTRKKMAFINFYFFLLKKFEKVEKTGFFRANTQISNLNVLHKGLLMQDWVFRLGMQLFCAECTIKVDEKQNWKQTLING